MGTPVTDPLPGENRSGEIGHPAKFAFQGNVPTSWRLKDLSSDSDAGYDWQIQVVHEGSYSELFHAQLKGTTKPAYSADGSVLSVGLRLATINYYKRTGLAVLLVVADLTSVEEPAAAPVYYLWIHDQLGKTIER